MRFYKLITLSILLLGSAVNVKSSQSGNRITLGTSLHTFASWSLSDQWYNVGENIYIHDIQEDEYIKGNLLVTVGNALFTVSPTGKHELIAGSVQSHGFANGYGKDALFNKTAGILQMDGGKVVIISDYFNFCLRKIDRQTKRVSTFAGRCNYYVPGGSRGRLCYRQADGPSTTAVFCTIAQMRYDNSTDKIYLLDVVKDKTRIRSVDPHTAYVSTVFSHYGFSAHNFLIDNEGGKSFVFALSPGILKWDAARPVTQGTWLAGCATRSYSNGCPSKYSALRSISTRLTHGLLKKNGVYVFTDMTGKQVYIADPENQRSVTVCESSSYSCSMRGPTSLAIVGDYLYIGEAVRISYRDNIHVNILRIKLSITPQEIYENSTGLWLKRVVDLPPRYDFSTTEFPDYVTKPTHSGNIAALVGGIVGGLVGLICCCLCVMKAASTKGELPMRTDFDRPINSPRRVYRRRWWLFVFRRRESESDEGETGSPPPYQRLDERGDNFTPAKPIQPPPYEDTVASSHLSPSP